MNIHNYKMLAQSWNVFDMHQTPIVYCSIGIKTSLMLRYSSGEKQWGMIKQYYSSTEIVSCVPYTRLVLACHVQVNQQKRKKHDILYTTENTLFTQYGQSRLPWKQNGDVHKGAPN